MIVYWVIFLSAAALALTNVRVSMIGWACIWAGLVAFVGLRYEVGGDWATYLMYLVRVTDLPFYQALAFKDAGYQALNWASARFGMDVWFVNVVAGGVFLFGLIRFVRALPDPRVALAAAIPYMVIVMGMGYTRQAMAFGFVLCGLTYLMERRLLMFVVLLGVAAAFHKSAVILVPLAVLSNTKNRWWSAVWVGAAGGVLFLVFLQSHVEQLYQYYVLSEYSSESEGGPIRAAMNFLPAVIFLLFRQRFIMSPEERALWFWVSIFCVLCVPLLAVSATAVDRVALYFMPIQLVVASYLPTFFRANSRILARAAVLGLYGTVLFVWLNYAGNRQAWLPYQFWPIA